jgi:hypothetical protein
MKVTTAIKVGVWDENSWHPHKEGMGVINNGFTGV